MRLANGRHGTAPTGRTKAKGRHGLTPDGATFSCCLIGPGRLGSALLRAFTQAGLTVAAVGVRHADRAVASPPRLPIPDAVRAAAQAAPGRPLLLWLTVPDDAIPTVAQRAAAAIRASEGSVAVHCSGLSSLDALEPLRRAGFAVLSLHPLQTFAAAGDVPLVGVPFAVTATDPQTERVGMSLAEQLGGRPFALPDEAKPLYHLSATMACNLLVALESEAAGLMHEATGTEGLAVLGPLMRTTLANLLADGPAHALTGPIARGDVGTVRTHLELLERRAPRHAAAYRALSLEALRLAAPRLDDDAVRTLRELLRSSPSPRSAPRRTTSDPGST